VQRAERREAGEGPRERGGDAGPRGRGNGVNRNLPD
jgi:hypothetical protein